jgi:putative (di)nucleoside polyphosphate hydrolase
MSNLPDNVFRANVGAVIINSRGYVLALQRHDHPDSWQMPQGGLNEHEEPLVAVFREVDEEIGLGRDQLALMRESKDWLAYELPPDRRTLKHGRGQVQKWFLLRLTTEQPILRFDKTDEQEFRSWRWMKLGDLIEVTADFRKPIYEQLAKEFSDVLVRP